jgi:uncharacterized protein (DUF427 family)|tara:strand:+ start:658 stop:1041 length:384 start_codon:yes stop_codon:yes gene_type:complete
MSNKSPGFERQSDYPLGVTTADGRVCVFYQGEKLANSERAICMTESTYDPVFYIPKDDVRMELLSATDHKTHCPFKGDASYWSITYNGATAVNAVWSYEKPFDEVAEIAGALAFYTSAVDSIKFDPN